MHTSSLALLIVAAGAVGFVHSVLPDHWVPLAVVARTHRWSLARVARVSALASAGHVLTSLALGGVVALVGLQFQRQIDTQQGHIVGGLLVLTGLGFLAWGLTGHGHDHSHDNHHSHDHGDDHEDHEHDDARQERGDITSGDITHGDVKTDVTAHVKASVDQSTWTRRFTAVVIPFGVAASPDLTILPVALAASAVGGGAIASTLIAFAVVTMATFIGLTVFATLAGYQIKGEWLEEHATTVTALVLVGIGIVAFIGL